MRCAAEDEIELVDAHESSKIFASTPVLPLSGFHQLFNLAFHEVTLQRTDVADVQLAVQVVGFVEKGTGQ